MAKKITYLLGAGASANAIPVVSFMGQRIGEFISKLKNYRNIQSNIIDQRRDLLIPNTKKLQGQVIFNNYERDLAQIISSLENLRIEASKHFTIDTLARKYFLKGRYDELKELKKALITYFTVEQYLFLTSIADEKNGYAFLKNEMDKRYDSFIATIAKRENKKLTLNNNINIVTWNYDSQFELTLKSYVDADNLNLLKNEYNIYPNPFFNDSQSPFNTNSFNVVKLNGTAIWDIANGQYFPNTIFDKPIPSLPINIGTPQEQDFLRHLGMLIELYSDAFSNNSHLDKHEYSYINPTDMFNFAWETDESFDAKHKSYYLNLDRAEKVASDTEILVVIGYSFPVFNREIDKRLFDKMDKLEKVYIQDKEPDRIKSTILNAFENITDYEKYDPTPELAPIKSYDALYQAVKSRIVKFQLEKFTDQFVIPFELHQ